MSNPTVLYFGALREIGHYLHLPGGRSTISPQRDVAGFPWTIGHLDSGLLKNGHRPDKYDGKVFWTCGGSPLWFAFFWWDRSKDTRSGSNSGFYVRGFEWPQVQEAFDFACSAFPQIVERQRQPLILQARPAPFPGKPEDPAERTVTT